MIWQYQSSINLLNIIHNYFRNYLFILLLFHILLEVSQFQKIHYLLFEELVIIQL